MKVFSLAHRQGSGGGGGKSRAALQRELGHVPATSPVGLLTPLPDAALLIGHRQEDLPPLLPPPSLPPPSLPRWNWSSSRLRRRSGIRTETVNKTLIKVPREGVAEDGGVSILAEAMGHVYSMQPAGGAWRRVCFNRAWADNGHSPAKWKG